MQNRKTPTALLLSRQNIPDIAALPGSSRVVDADQAERGAYVVRRAERPDVILVGNGSEVAVLMEVAAVLESAHKLNARVVSAISDAVFGEQDEQYRESVLPLGVPTVGLTAVIPDTMRGLVGPLGMVIGLSRFGASAPFTVLDEKFGYTAKAVAPKVVEFVKGYDTALARLNAARGR
jgi:transketolase